MCEELKAIIIGETGCGKTWLLTAFMHGNLTDIVPTIGIEYHTKLYSVDRRQVKVRLWDTAGQERYQLVPGLFYRNAQAIALVYDVANRRSFEKVHLWIQQVRQYVNNSYLVMLIGNKMDLVENREVDTEEGLALAQQFGFFFMETSALESRNVEKAFDILIRAACQHTRLVQESYADVLHTDKDVIRVEEEVEPQRSSCFLKNLFKSNKSKLDS